MLEGMDLAQKARKTKGNRTYRELADACGCSPENIRKIIDQGSEPKFRLGMKLADALCVDPHWLADDTTEWPPPASDRQRAVELVERALESAGLLGELSDVEREMLSLVRRLPAEKRGELLGMARAWALAPEAESGGNESSRVAALNREIDDERRRRAAEEQRRSCQNRRA